MKKYKAGKKKKKITLAKKRGIECLFKVSEECKSCSEICPHNDYNAYMHN